MGFRVIFNSGMPKISVGDLTGSVNIDMSDTSLPGKPQLSGLTTATAGLLAELPAPVAGAKFQDAKFSAVFDKPSIPLQGNTLDVKASVNCIVAVARASNSPLFGKDDYDPIEIKSNECWVSLELDTLLDATVAAPLPYGFGVCFETSTAPGFATYVLIPGAPGPPTTLQQAIVRALGAFNILDSAADVLAIPPGTVYTADMAGTIKIAGSWSLPIAVNQLSLAGAELPFNSSISVKPAAAVKVKGYIALTSEFNVRFRRTASNLLRIGLYKKRGATFDASFTASAGLVAEDRNTDLINAFFTAAASGADVSGMQPPDAAKIKKVLSDSIDRSLAICLNAACSAAFSDEAAVAYELDISTADPSTSAAIDDALHGDWTAIARLPNARKIRNAIIDTVETNFTLSVNFLGLYNYRSVADFVRSMEAVANLETGLVLITDTATARRIVTSSTALGADPDKLRAALYEGFVATATYKALLAGMGAQPAFCVTQDLLLYKNSMPYRDALKQLNAGEVLGVMLPAAKTTLPPSGGPVHHARFAASCTYSNDDVLRFFFTDIQDFIPRELAGVKKMGRKVLASLLDPQDPADQKRIAVLLDDDEWTAMDAHPPQISMSFYPDWYDITHWAAAIAAVGPLLADAIRFARTVAGDPMANLAFTKKRAALLLALDGVTHNAHAAFDHAFPLCAMATLAGRTPGTPAPVFEARWNGATVFGK